MFLLFLYYCFQARVLLYCNIIFRFFIVREHLELVFKVRLDQFSFHLNLSANLFPLPNTKKYEMDMNHIEGMIRLTRKFKSLQNHLVMQFQLSNGCQRGYKAHFCQFKLTGIHYTLSEKAFFSFFGVLHVPLVYCSR